LPLQESFLYEVPPDLEPQIVTGAQVTVPFRSRRLRGFVVEVLDGEPRPGLRPIESAAGPPVDERIMRLTRWVADYYVAPWGEVLRTAVPRPVGRIRLQETPTGRSTVPERGLELKPTKHQRAALSAIAEQVAREEFKVILLQGVTGSGKTYVYCKAAAEVIAAGGSCLVLVPEISLSTQLVDRFRHFFGDDVILSHSALSQSERYVSWVRAASGDAKVVVGARSAVFSPLKNLKLIVVDEEHEPSYKQSDVPRYNARDVAVKRGQLEGCVVLLGSATPSLETYNNAVTGKYTRVLLPCRIDSRPMAEVRIVDLKAARPGGTVGEETAGAGRNGGRSRGEDDAGPGTEGGRERHGEEGRFPGGAGAGALSGRGENSSWLFSDVLTRKMTERLSRGEQVILFINRRGHSTFVQCRDCGGSFRCPRCEVTLTYHSDPHRLTCHYCGYSSWTTDTCPKCGGSNFWYGGVGTQKVEKEIRRMFPEVGVLRMDVDSTRRKGAQRTMVEEFSAGKALVLLGTQMVAKGLDFPNVTLVGVVYADTQLNIPDFRASERTFQLMTQVAGRAGRGGSPGEVIIQTFLPDHPSLKAASLQDFELFYRNEIKDRRELMFPPFTRLVDISFTASDEKDVVSFSNRVKHKMEEWVRDRGMSSVDVLGPAPYPISRLRGKLRWHIMLRGRSVAELRKALDAARSFAQQERPSSLLVGIDVDPMQLM